MTISASNDTPSKAADARQLKGFLDTLQSLQRATKGNNVRLAELTKRERQIQKEIDKEKEKALVEYNAKLKRIDIRAEKELRPVRNQREFLERKNAKNAINIEQLEEGIHALDSSGLPHYKTPPRRARAMAYSQEEAERLEETEKTKNEHLAPVTLKKTQLDPSPEAPKVNSECGEASMGSRQANDKENLTAVKTPIGPILPPPTPLSNRTNLPSLFSEQVFTLCQLLGCQTPPAVDTTRHEKLLKRKHELKKGMLELKLALKDQRHKLILKEDAKLELEIAEEDAQVMHGKLYSKIAQDIVKYMEAYDGDKEGEQAMLRDCQARFNTIQTADQIKVEPIQNSLEEVTSDIKDIQIVIDYTERELEMLLRDYAQVRNEFNDMEKRIAEPGASPPFDL